MCDISALATDEMYKLWLSGWSIRKIAAYNNIGRMGCWGKLTRKYGKNACSPRFQSLARVVYKEYGDIDLAMKAMGTEGLYRSEKTEENVSRNQTYDLSKVQLSYLEPERDTRLNWYGFRLLTDTIADTVADLYAASLMYMVADANGLTE